MTSVSKKVTVKRMPRQNLNKRRGSHSPAAKRPPTRSAARPPVTPVSPRLKVRFAPCTAPQPRLVNRSDLPSRVSASNRLTSTLYRRGLTGCKLLLALSLLSLAHAQPLADLDTRPVGATTDVVALVDAAERDVLLLADDLLSGEVALALIRAAHERGVHVEVVLAAGALRNEAGYGPYLSLYTTLQVTPELVGRSLLVIDHTTAVEGPLVAAPATLFNAGETVAFRGRWVAARVETFRRAWRRSSSFEVDETFLRNLMEAR